MQKILVVAVNWLGDAVFSTPVFRALRQRYPQARIACLCVPRVKEVLALCPDIDEIIEYDEDGEDRPLVAKASLVQRLSAGKYDAAFILRKSLSRTLMLWLAGIPVRVGFAGKGWSWLLTHRANGQGTDAFVHRSDIYLRAVESLGIGVTDRTCFLKAPEDMVRGWRDRLAAMGIKPGDRLIMINTGGNWDLKQWPETLFVTLVREIHRRGLGRAVLPGAGKDVERVKRIAVSSGVDPVVAAGETSIASLAGLMAHCSVMVTADTGPLHVAAALGLRTVALFGPTRPEVTGPRGQVKSIVIQKDAGCNRAPCYNLECPDNKCMKTITVEDVLSAIGKDPG